MQQSAQPRKYQKVFENGKKRYILLNRENPGICVLCGEERKRVHKNIKNGVSTCPRCSEAARIHGDPVEGICTRCGKFLWLVYKYWRTGRICRRCYVETAGDHRHC